MIGFIKIFFWQMLIDQNVDVDVRNTQNGTPLHVALKYGAQDCVDLLLKKGANYNLQVSF